MPFNIILVYFIRAMPCVSEIEADALSVVVRTYIMNNQLKRQCSFGFSSALITCYYLHYHELLSICKCSIVDFSSSTRLSSNASRFLFWVQHSTPAESMKFVETLFAYLLIATFDIVVRPKRTRPHDSLLSPRPHRGTLHRTFIHAKSTRPPQTFNEFSLHCFCVNIDARVRRNANAPSTSIRNRTIKK